MISIPTPAPAEPQPLTAMQCRYFNMDCIILTVAIALALPCMCSLAESDYISVESLIVMMNRGLKFRLGLPFWQAGKKQQLFDNLGHDI